MDRLFDPDSFRSAADSGREFGVSRRQHNRYNIPPGVETPGEGWFLITTTLGPVPEVHRVGETLADGSIITTCNQVGRVLMTVEPGTHSYPCETCRLG